MKRDLVIRESKDILEGRIRVKDCLNGKEKLLRLPDSLREHLRLLVNDEQYDPSLKDVDICITKTFRGDIPIYHLERIQK